MLLSSNQLSSLQKLDHAITKFQEFAGLEVTGGLNEETVDMMRKPRCGVKDFIDEDEDADSPRIKVRGLLSRKKVCRNKFRLYDSLRDSEFYNEGEVLIILFLTEICLTRIKVESEELVLQDNKISKI